MANKEEYRRRRIIFHNNANNRRERDYPSRICCTIEDKRIIYTKTMQEDSWEQDNNLPE
jgi:hypothetical protein